MGDIKYCIKLFLILNILKKIINFIFKYSIRNIDKSIIINYT